MTNEYIDLFLNSYTQGNFDRYEEKEKNIRVNNIISEIQQHHSCLEYFIDRIDSTKPELYVFFSHFISLDNKTLLLRNKILDSKKINEFLLKDVSLIIPGFLQIYDKYCKDKKYENQLLEMLNEAYFREKFVYEKLSNLNKQESIEDNDINRVVIYSDLDIFAFYMRYNKHMSCKVRGKVINKIRDQIRSQKQHAIKDSREQIKFYDNIVESVINSMQISYPDIEKEKLLKILDLFNSNIIKVNIIFDIFFDNIDTDNFESQLANINLKIDKEFQIFFNEKLPNNFRMFEMFKYSEVNDKRNYLFPGSMDFENRDMQIKGDLFRILLESNNQQMIFFLKILYYGDLAFESLQSDMQQPNFKNEILVEYRNMLNLLLLITGSEKTFETKDIYNDLISIKNMLNLNDNESLSSCLLKKYVDSIDFKLEIKDGNLVKSLLQYINQLRNITTNNNCKLFEFQDGDIIRGTEIKYLSDILDNGIRAREFYLTNNPVSDYTPLAADFSKISQEGVENRTFPETIETTYSPLYEMWLVIKKEDYDGISYYSDNANGIPLVNLRTGIGSSNIRAIIAKQLTKEIKIILSKKEFFIPVLDYYSGKILFSYEDYEFIRNNLKEQEKLDIENDDSNLKKR